MKRALAPGPHQTSLSSLEGEDRDTAAARRTGTADAATPAALPPSPGGAAGTPRVIGIDPSLTATAVAFGQTATIVTRLRGHARLTEIKTRVVRHVDGADLVVIEGPSYGSMSGAGHHESAGLWWIITGALHDLRIPYAVAPPSVLKKYATGKGNATKPDMRMALFQRTGMDIRDDNQCDAWWLRAIGLDHLGQPPVELPKAHREALTKVAWPETAVS